MAVAYDSAIRYVLLVLWMTLHFTTFHIMEPMSQNQRHVIEFARWGHRDEVVCCL